MTKINTTRPAQTLLHPRRGTGVPQETQTSAPRWIGRRQFGQTRNPASALASLAACGGATEIGVSSL